MVRLPDFLIIGAYKSGTTSLVEYLGQHPQVFLPWLQEPNYFAHPADSNSTARKPDIEWGSVYRRHRTNTMRQYAALFEDAPPGSIVGECSPEYMRSPHAVSRIHETLPNVKLVAILRNPVERAHSDYQAFVRDSIETEDFAAAVRRSPGLEPGHQYVLTGFYGRQLKPYYDMFGADRIKVLLNDDLRSDSLGSIRGLGDWLGVETKEWEPNLNRNRNVSGRPGNVAVSTAFRLRRRLRPWLKPIVPQWAQRRADGLLVTGLKREPIAPDVRGHLVDIYREDVSLLQALIGRDLSGWLANERAGEPK